MTEIILKPIKYSYETLGMPPQEPEWKRSLRYLDYSGWLLGIIKKGCRAAANVPFLAPLAVVAAPLGAIAGTAKKASFAAGTFFATDELAARGIKADLPSAKEALGVAEQGVDLISMVAECRSFGVPLFFMTGLNTVQLAFGLISPIITLMIQLKEKGSEAFEEFKFYKILYKIVLSLLAIYLFVTSISLSLVATVLLAGISFAISYI
jgi:hypothetical protein